MAAFLAKSFPKEDCEFRKKRGKFFCFTIREWSGIRMHQLRDPRVTDWFGKSCEVIVSREAPQKMRAKIDHPNPQVVPIGRLKADAKSQDILIQTSHTCCGGTFLNRDSNSVTGETWNLPGAVLQNLFKFALYGSFRDEHRLRCGRARVQADQLNRLIFP